MGRFYQWRNILCLWIRELPVPERFYLTNGEYRGDCPGRVSSVLSQAGMVEHDAQEIWYSQRSVAEKAIAAAGVGPWQIEAIGITNQRENVHCVGQGDRGAGVSRYCLAVPQDGACD